MIRVVPIVVLLSFAAAGCREIWYWQPVGAHHEVRDGQGYWIDLGEVEFGSYCPFVVAPWERGEETAFWGFTPFNKADAGMALGGGHGGAGDGKIQSSLPNDDKTNGVKGPARGSSEFSMWISFPPEGADNPREFVLSL